MSSLLLFINTTLQLRKLEEHGIIYRTVYRKVYSLVEYELTAIGLN
ncbi:winged helix-turn-helix transcriptional regulator [Myroides odoratus]|nr:winged helix-turn-helix transcriptional regulator [Myroides odoratus]MCS4238266.1 DNA-binding HxlR family transcriptional regulator [Myroides odoratus]